MLAGGEFDPRCNYSICEALTNIQMWSVMENLLRMAPLVSYAVVMESFILNIQLH